jgi:hypothetical protein
MRHLTRTEFRHDADDKQRWLDAAEACGLSLSEFIRAALKHKIDGTPMPVRKAVTFGRMNPVALRLLRHIAKSFEVATIAAIAEDIIALVRADLGKIERENGELAE